MDRLLIFDCDGVLVDSEILEHTVDAEMLAVHGYHRTAEELLGRFVGISRKDMYATVFDELGRPIPANILDVRERTVWTRCARDLRIVPGVDEALRILSVLPKCVASSSTPDKLQMKLEITGLAPWFAPNIFSTALVQRGKPAPDIYLHASQAVGVPPERCTVIEDSPHGIAGARAAGMHAIGFGGGAHATASLRTQLVDAGADAVANSMDELSSLLLAAPPS
ncbi:MAG: hypothetical protein FD144_1857 [Rhodospirillaceae bacterium]|nr:MAG: hypothetical protein FD144_1857 [Rhodospirillaceae bacterium]